MATTTKKEKPVVPPLDLSKIDGWNDKYFKVDRKKSRKKGKKKPTEKKPGLGDTEDAKGLDISDEVSEGLAAMFDETSGPYQYQFHREQVSLAFDPAVKVEPSLQPKMDRADDLAEDEDYDAGVKDLKRRCARLARRCWKKPSTNGRPKKRISSPTARWPSDSRKCGKRNSLIWMCKSISSRQSPLFAGFMEAKHFDTNVDAARLEARATKGYSNELAATGH